MKKIVELFQNQKLNRKFTLLIVLFTIVPIGIFAGILFYVMEQNVIDENKSYLSYTMERNQDALISKIDSINMSTQFFLSDDALLEILNQASVGEDITTEQWLSFKENHVSSLERLVYNNPLLYGVRVYASNDDVQEMMPILYQQSRMQKQDWTNRDDFVGWSYNYNDNIFSSYSLNQNRKLIALITPIVDRKNGRIGTIEAAMTMDNMLPSLYESIENEWSFFYSNQGNVYYGDNEQYQAKQLQAQIIASMPQSDEIMTIYEKITKQHLVISYMQVRELEGTLICVKDITQSVQEVYRIRNIFVAIMILFLGMLALVINHIVQHLLRQFYRILRSIRQVQKGDLNVTIENCGKDEMGELGTQINKMLERIRQLMQDNVNRERLVKNSEIRALQNQINAHFIYNVLESIKMMAEIEEKFDISDAITALGRLLRYSMKWSSSNVLVEQELEYIKNYMALINLRFDYEIYLSLNLPDIVLKQEIPKMSLQPIVENAIYHGIEQIAEDTNIYIKGLVEGDDCVIEILDSGKGMTDEQVEELRMKIAGELDSNGGSGNGIGLKNVQDRIHIAFGEKYGIEIASKLDCYTKIMVRIPMTHTHKEV